MQNLVDLCRPTSSKFKGLPFVPKVVRSFDMFPHTNHVEVVLELIRQEEFEVMAPETRLLPYLHGTVGTSNQVNESKSDTDSDK